MLLAAAASAGPADAAAGGAYTVAVVPQFPPAVIKRDWGPLVARLAKKTGLRLKLRFYRSIPEFEEDFLKGRPDFVYLNPLHAVQAANTQGYIPLVRDDQSALAGILVVRSDSPIRDVRELEGRIISFPSPNAFAASLYMQALLKSRHRLSFTPRYAGTHSNVYRSVNLGVSAAGGGVNKTLAREPEGLRRQLRVIYETPEVAPHPLCAHPRVPAPVREELARAFLELAADEEGARLVRKIGMAQPVRAGYDRDYAPLEALGLQRPHGNRSRPQ